MRTRMLRRLAVTFGCLSLFILNGAAFAQGGTPLHADLDGASEVPVLGDPDGSGRALIRVNSGQGTVCYNITVSNVNPILAAHIHLGAAGVPGGILVELPPSGGQISGCTSGVDKELIKAIRKDPEAYYVNVHNNPFFGGALRGQLEKGF